MSRRWAVAVTLLAAAVMLVSAVSISATRAAAWFMVDETGTPGHLWLMTDRVDPMMLSPGVPVHWQVRASLVDPAGTLELQIRREGQLVELTDALQFTLQQCAVEWSIPSDGPPHCAHGRTDLLGPIALADPAFGAFAGPADTTPHDAPSWNLGLITHNSHEYFLATLWIDDTPENRADSTLMGLEATIGLGFLAEAADAPAPPGGAPPALPSTGADALALVLLVGGVIALVIGTKWVRA